MITIAFSLRLFVESEVVNHLILISYDYFINETELFTSTMVKMIPEDDMQQN